MATCTSMKGEKSCCERSSCWQQPINVQVQTIAGLVACACGGVRVPYKGTKPVLGMVHCMPLLACN